MPDESVTACTVSVAVELPQDTPFLSVSLKPVPGWKGTITKATLPKPVVEDGTTLTEAARTVTWTAVDGSAAVAPGQYQEFSISVGPLPSPRSILLPVAQTYSDGSVVHWDEATPASGSEPEHPAPALVVTPKAATAASPVPTSDTSSTGSGSGSGNGLSVAALIVAVLVAVLAGVSLVTRRRGSAAEVAT